MSYYIPLFVFDKCNKKTYVFSEIETSVCTLSMHHPKGSLEDRKTRHKAIQARSQQNLERARAAKETKKGEL
jgi:hypothetical protein